MAGFPTPFPLAPLDPAWGLSFQNPNPFDTHPPLLQFNNSLKEDGGDDAIDDVNIDVDGLHDAANFILGNTLHYTPHNFHQPIIIPYPTTIGGCYDDTNNNKKNKNKNNNNSNVISLPVCDKCKRHYKTRDICRIKHGHTDVPWTNTYICITIDKSCIDNNGKYIIRNDHKLYVVNLPSPPQLDNNEKNSITTMSNKYVVNSCLDEKAPVCLNCKQSNRSRAYCRKKFRHRELPWNTLFVMLKLQQQHVGTCSSSGAAGSITFQSSGASSERDGDDGAIADFLNTTFRDGDGGGKIEEDNNKMPPLPTLDHLLAAAAEKEEEEEIQEEEPQQTQNQKEESNKLEAEFDINCIAPSRTFLSIISSTENSIRWLTNIAADDNTNSEEMLEKSSYQQQSREIDFLSSKPLGRDSSCRATVSVSTKTKKRKKASSTGSSWKNKSKKQKPLDNAALALQAIEYAKQQAKKEQDTALLMTQRFTRFAQQPLLMQQQQQQQLLLQQQQQQQAMYQLQDTTEQQRKLSRSNDQPYGDEAMQVAEINEPVDEDKMPILNGEDILDEAAKLAEWL